MDHFTMIEKRNGCDVKKGCDLHPEDGRGRVGKSGFDKKLKLNDLLDIAYSMNNPRPNIIIKAGKNAKWYLKFCMVDKIEEKIEENRKHSTAFGPNRCTMYIVKWD